MSEPLDIVEVLRRPLETISQCRRMLYVTAEVAEIAAAEIAWLREERPSISTLLQKVESLEEEITRLREERRWVTLPMPFEPWRYGPLSYRKCEVLAALRKAGVKWRKLPPGPEGDG